MTRYCIHPERELDSVARVGGTKKFDFEAIAKLTPDLILGNKEENYLEGVERLRGDYPVWMSDIYNLDDALSMITQVALMVDASAAGARLCARIRQGFDDLDSSVPDDPDARACRAAYFIWRKPYMAVGGNNFIDHLLNRIGYDNVFGELDRYPELSAEQIAAAAPDVILLSSEPFPFTDAHREEFETLVPDARVRLVDGTMFSWYGSRLQHVPEYLMQVLSPSGAIPVQGVG